MLTSKANQRLTRVGPGTPMGELMRRYWQPIAASITLKREPVIGLRLLGEDLVLFRQPSGRYGLVEAACPHRGTSLEMGIPEDGGIRCSYHGWKFDCAGECIDTPLEPATSKLRGRVRIAGYPLQELGGLLWAYLGPAPAPVLPRWDLFVAGNAFRQIGVCTLECNWLQCMENSVDPTHGVYLHGHYFRYILERDGVLGTDAERFRKRALRGARPIAKIAFDRFEHGIRKRRLFVDQDENEPEWTVGHPLVFPVMVRLGGDVRNEFQIRVPIDDTHTWHVSYQCYQFGADVEVPRQDDVPVFDVPLRDAEGKRILDFTLAQDVAAWEMQGNVTNRSRERLGASDKGISLYRRMLREELAKVAAGQDPMNVFRDATGDRPIELPVGTIRPEDQFGRSALHRGFAMDDIDRYSPVLDQLVELYARAENGGS